MFLRPLLSHDKKEAAVAAQKWLSTVGDLHHVFRVNSGEQELAGIRSLYLDIYPDLDLPKYHGFGGLFVRVWAIESDPIPHILFGIYLGAKVSKSQDEIRRGVAYTRQKLARQFDELEMGAEPPFRYSTWTDRQIPWLGSGASKRGVVRQFDLFLTHSLERAPGNNVEEGTARLVTWLDRSVSALKPVSEFAKAVTLSFFLPPEALPPNSSEKEVQTRFDSVPVPVKPLSDIRWPEIKEEDAPCGLVGLVTSFERSVSAMKSGKHVILIGPPGTGKTELAQCICDKAGVEFEICTATSDWTTFDTIGGYFPTPDSTEDSKLDFLPAIVLQSIEKERWLIIDEINRADIDKAFGELFTLLSGKPVRLPYRKRIGDRLMPVVLCHGTRESGGAYIIRVPRNWRILGTMNTFDKASLFQLSYAFMRRFAFIDIPVPSERGYAEILKRCLQRHSPQLPSDMAEEIGILLQRVFVSPGGHLLREMGLAVGPAIPIDIIKFLSERAEGARASEGEEVADYTRNLVTEALEMFLFPQFEGKDRHHPAILRLLIDALRLPESEQPRTREILSTWTGYEA